MKTLAPLAAITLLGACSQPAETPVPAPTATVAGPRTLVAAELDPAALGAKIEGPDGTDPDFPMLNKGEEIGRVVSFVACPKGMTTCDPAALPAGTMLTYVHTIVPGDPGQDAVPSPAATNPAGATEVPAALFRMTRPVSGFNGVIGYSRAQAAAALGAEDAITVSADNGQLIWRVTGGTGWRPGLPITVWWQTSAPPAGPQEAYALSWNASSAVVKAPFPAPEKPVEQPAAR